MPVLMRISSSRTSLSDSLSEYKQLNQHAVRFQDIYGGRSVSKYNYDGSNSKTELLGTSSDDKAYSVQLDSNNQIYITGYTNGFSSTRDSDIFLVSPIFTQ